MKKLRLKDFRDFFDIAWYTRGRARMKYPDVSKFSKRNVTQPMQIFTECQRQFWNGSMCVGSTILSSVPFQLGRTTWRTSTSVLWITTAVEADSAGGCQGHAVGSPASGWILPQATCVVSVPWLWSTKLLRDVLLPTSEATRTELGLSLSPQGCTLYLLSVCLWSFLYKDICPEDTDNILTHIA